MPKCVIDGKEVEFKPGEMVIQVADRVGVEIPRFCYHPGLTVVAQCRMCAVEVEKMGKIQTACSLPAAEGMVVHTASPKVKAARESVMEFTLINHPLDCPICDEAGECTLQDYSFAYGKPDSRYEEYRRSYIDLDMGPVIKKNMNRCIHCTRCIRFCDEVGGFREMVALKRGNQTEITTVDGKPLETEYAGNLADICPTGSLTLVDFRFKKRSWFLKKTPSICEGCSQGCNLEVQQDNNEVFRHWPRENMEINKWWLCDEGRFSFKHVNAETRVTEPVVRGADKGIGIVDWKSAVEAAKAKVTGKTLVLVGSDLTLEEMTAVQNFAKTKLHGAALFHFGTPGITKASDDKAEDKLLRRTSKTSNLHGAEKLGLKGWDGGSAKYDSALVFRGGRATVIGELKKVVTGAVVAVGVYDQTAIDGFDIVLPGLSYAEKTGTIVNWQGKEQKLNAAIEPVGQSRALDEMFALWS